MSENTADTTDIVLVPSAIVVPDELRLDVGAVPTGMIPLEGKPMLEHIANEYEDFNVSFVVAVHEQADTIRQYASQSNHAWNIVDVGDTDRLGKTVMNALDALSVCNSRNRSLYINFADTLVSPVRQVNETDYVSHKPVERTYRWTTFQSEEDHISTVSPKYEATNALSQQAFVGQFGFTSAGTFFQCLCSDSDTGGGDLPPFYTALMGYLSTRDYELYMPENWLDVGHLDTFHRAKKDFLNTREFNRLQVSTKNVITKRSEDTETLINEIEWYQQIPTDLQPYLPRLYDWSTDPSDAFLKMEYIGYPSLADIQLHTAHSQYIWDGIFHRILDVLSEFQEHTLEPDPPSIRNALKSIYLFKTRRRLNQFREDAQFAEFFRSDQVRVNGAAVPSLDDILSQLESILYNEDILSRTSLSIVHGDFCSPNILYDPRNEIVKLIDPRGAFGEFTIYGDPQYDLAKLRHSFVGHYEHLINDHFTAEATHKSAEISYDINTTVSQDRRAERFDSILEKQSQASLRKIKLIEALLFLSMVPLHSDRFERQLCMLGQGLEKIAPFLNE